MEHAPRRRQTPSPLLDDSTMMRIASVESHLSCGVIDAGTMNISHDPPGRSLWDLFIATPERERSRSPSAVAWPMPQTDGRSVLALLAAAANAMCSGCSEAREPGQVPNVGAWSDERAARRAVQSAQQSVANSSLHKQLALFAAPDERSSAISGLSPLLVEQSVRGARSLNRAGGGGAVALGATNAVDAVEAATGDVTKADAEIVEAAVGAVAIGEVPTVAPTPSVVHVSPSPATSPSTSTCTSDTDLSERLTDMETMCEKQIPGTGPCEASKTESAVTEGFASSRVPAVHVAAA